MWFSSGGGGSAPVFQSAEVGNVADDTLVMTYNQTLDSGSVPATTDFSVDDGAANAVTNVSISGTDVTLTLTNSVNAGDTVVVSYTAGANPIQDTSGNDAANLTNESVTNNAGTFMLDSDGNRVKDSYGNDIILPH